MATFGTGIRRGLPRVPGGEPWPPASTVQVAQTAGSAPVTPPDATPEQATPEQATPEQATPELAAPASAIAGGIALRRGLPRVPGGEPWPPAATVQVAQMAGSAPVTAQDATPEQATPEQAAPASVIAGGAALRRGLPRVPGGEPWPPAAETGPLPAAPVAASVVPARTAPAPAGTPSGVPLSQPLPFPRTVFPGRYAFTRPAPAPEPRRIGPFTRLQWAGAVIVAGGGLLFAAGMAVLFVRWLLSLPVMVDFVAAFPGEYHLPAGAPVGIPPWLGWQHFFNVFLIVLIIRSGLQVRTEKRPTVFWSPRSNGKRKISLNLWFHQSLDILWIVNGVIFVVLLFVTGQWMKIVPTSWEVFPNAISAGLQYVSLDWPTENGWVNYNSLQQLAYFTTVFLAAPLAIATGVRMSGIWPGSAKALSKAYPVEWARAVHFPVMLYFVAFIIVHVALVFATGALRNLNHMYASQDAVNWAGFWIFAASMLVIVAGWVAARPLILAPIARLFGSVSGR